MNKNAIKKYAIWARNELIDRVSKKALRYGISAAGKADPKAESVDGKILTETERKQRTALIARITAHGYEQTMEEVAYTWFNRFAALRFMEVNGYLPSHVRVFTNDAGEFKPQILAEAIHLDMPGLNMDKVYAFKEADKNEDLFRYLIIVQSNALNEILPGMFQRIDDYTELLLPDNLLREGSVIERLIVEIPEEDWRDQVQIIGWLYQYYNTEPKDKVFADLKKNIKVTKEKIPAATQLFTPDWIVRYMVENSLGRLWLEGHPNDTLKADWKYYLDEAEQEEEVQKQLAEIRKEYAHIKPEDIRCIDPCMGSGHILCYLFDVLMQIYQDYGHTPREAVASILENNLYGLDIDDRAAQLSYFAVMMKARQYDRRFFSRKIQPKVMAIQESNGLKAWREVAGDSLVGGQLNFDDSYIQMADYLIETFHDAKEYGSILTVEPNNYDDLLGFIERVKQEDGNLLFRAWIDEIDKRIVPLVQQAKILSAKFDVVVTNPPYMGGSNMSAKFSAFVKKNYADYKSDLFSACMVNFLQMAKSDGYVGFLSPYVWMFISSYEKLRHLFIDKKTIETLVQFEYSAFEEATVPICTFVLQNRHIDKKGCYLRLVDYRGGMEVQQKKALEAIETHDKKLYFEADAKNFAKIPGAPVAYWASENVFQTFSEKSLGMYAEPRGGLTTTDNARFLRFWYEVNKIDIAFDITDTLQTENMTEKWCPIAKGGEYRKWYGNNDYIVLWYKNGQDIKHHVVNNPNDPNTKSWSRRIFNHTYYFRPCVTWSGISSGNLSVRMADNQIFGGGGKALFSERNLEYYCALLNTNVSLMYLSLVSPTLNYESGHIAKIPVIISGKGTTKIKDIVKENISLSKTDWDSFETSWDFERHPLV